MRRLHEHTTTRNVHHNFFFPLVIHLSFTNNFMTSKYPFTISKISLKRKIIAVRISLMCKYSILNIQVYFGKKQWTREVKKIQLVVFVFGLNSYCGASYIAPSQIVFVLSEISRCYERTYSDSNVKIAPQHFSI